MANTRKTILNALATQLANSSKVKTATRELLAPTEARKQAPYVGMVVETEEEIVEDSTHVRYELDVSLILLHRKTTTDADVETMLDAVKTVLYNSSTASAIGAKAISVTGQEEVALVNDDQFSSTRVALTITYVATKGAF